MNQLYLGVAREIITPEVGCQLYGYAPDVFSVAVADDLTATAFYFRQENKQALMISTTVCSIKTELARQILCEIETKFQIPKECCMLSATHTHSGPNLSGTEGWGEIDQSYIDSIFLPNILKAAEKAVLAAKPVTVGWSVGKSDVGINRRQPNHENISCLGQNPWGLFNPNMYVISFRDKDKNTVANIIHYGAHCTAAGRYPHISRDWAGIMIDTLEEESGGITAFFNGTEGDVGPRLSNGKTTGNKKHVYETGYAASRDAIRIYHQIIDYHTPLLLSGTNQVQIPLKPKMPLEEAKALYEEHKECTVNYRAMIRKQAESIIKAYEMNVEDEQYFTFGQPMIALGGMVFLGAPYELFSEMGIRIDEAFKDMAVLSCTNTNGSEGYFVTQSELCRGGYEVEYFKHHSIQPCCDDADFHYITQSIKNIKKIIGEE